MNFLDLYKKIQSLDTPVNESMAPPSGPIQGDGISAYPIGECGMGECGADMPAQQPKQNDSVTMNVNMSGSGEGGIRSLMNILRNIEDKIEPSNDHDDVIIGEPEEVSMKALEDESKWANSADDTEVSDIDAVLPVGNDLASNTGDRNVRKMDMPMAHSISVSESLIKKLTNHYEEVKCRTVTEGDWKPVQYGYGDPETWGGRRPDEDDGGFAHGIERDVDEAEIDLPPELHDKFPSNWFSFTYEFDGNGDLELHKILTYDEESNNMVDVTNHKDVLITPIWEWIEKHDLDNYEDDYMKYAKSHNDDYY